MLWAAPSPSYRGSDARMARPKVSPVVWTPPPAPARARADIGTRPLPPLRRVEVPGVGPEAAVAPDGTIYFSVSSARFGIDHWRAELFEHSGTGRLLRRDPSGAVEPVVEGLEFANGVALAPDGSFVLVAETTAYRLTRLWLTGDRASSTDVFADNLPGFPDNISTGTDGLIWVTQATPRDAVLDKLLPRPPVLRKLAWALPDRLQPQEKRTVWVLAYDADGTLVHDLQGPGRSYHLVTGVREHHGAVWLGSLVETAIAVLDLGPGE